MSPPTDLTWRGYPAETYADYRQRVLCSMSDDPHAKPLSEAIQYGWSEDLQMEGGRLKGSDCWLHTTSDGIIHVGWAKTFCGIHVQWENSQVGVIESSTCSSCHAEWSAMKLDPESWRERQEAK